MQAQEYLCNLPGKIRRLAELHEVRRSRAKKAPVPFTWLFDRPLVI
jgi:acyl-[acyl-carrier-protein] desaturase